MSELRRCPFCGGEADTLCAVGFFAVPINKVYCMECGALVEGYSNEVDAIEAWNRREPIDKVVEQLEEKVKEIKKFNSITYEADIFVDARREALLEAIEIVKGGAE